MLPYLLTSSLLDRSLRRRILLNIVLSIPPAAIHYRSDAGGDSVSVVESVSQWLPRLNALVVGPGLGREASQLATVSLLLQRAREREMDIVIDAVSVC